MTSNVQINPAQSALQNLLNLVDSQNPAGPSNPAQVTTANLTAVTVGSVSSDPTADTSVEIDGIAGHGYSGAVTIYYAREPLTTQVSAVGGSVNIPSGTTDGPTILGLVATHYGFIPSEISWVTVPHGAVGSGAGTGTIQSSGSLIYNDGQATVNLNWQ